MNFNLFSVLKFRDFRLLWLGLLISNLGTWSQLYAEQWYLFSFREKATDVSLLVFVQAVPSLLFMLLGGILADRYNRRKMLFFTQSTQAFLTLVLAVLITTHVMNLYLYLMITFLYGLVIGLDIPARRSIVPNILPTEYLSKGLSLYNATFQLSAFAGPMIGSTLVGLFGYEQVFYLNVFSFSAILYAVWQMKIPERIQSLDFKPTLFRELRHVGTVFRNHRVLLTIISLNFLFILIGKIDYLFPSISNNLLHIDVGQAGWLNSSLGIGVVVGSVAIGTFDQAFKKNTSFALFSQVALLCITSWILSVSSSIWIDCITVALRGAFLSIGGILLSNFLQTSAPDEHLGKVMGVQNSIISLAQMISFPIGVLTDRLGIQAVLEVFAICSAFSVLFLLYNHKKVRLLHSPDTQTSA